MTKDPLSPSIVRIALILFCVGAMSLAQNASRPAKTQQVCLPETDPNSPRKSLLKSAPPKPGEPDPDEIIRLDLDGDGTPDIIEHWWHGKRCRWIGEGHSMKWTDVRGAMVNDVLQIDRDGDGYYDGPGDINIKWCDDDGDGRPDLEIFAANPSIDQKTPSSGLSHYMIFVDDDHDGVLGYIDWQTFEFGRSCWRVPATRPGQRNPDPNFSPDYVGDSTFLKQHLPAWLSSDPRYNWENPFLFYDCTGSGCTNMSIRILDTTEHDADWSETKPMVRYRGKANEAYVAYDLDANAQLHNELDYDMTIRFASAPDGSKGERIDYNSFHNKHPKMKAPEWALKYFRYPNWRQIDEFIYVPHDKAYDEIFKPKWGEAWLVFDEDNDDHRWERVEMYYPSDDVYSTARWKKGHTGGGLDGHGQSDTLGDRGEWDFTNKGQGKLYIGKWDHKIHLYGADKGAWTVDYGAKFWGSSPVVGDSSPEKAPKVEEVVQYEDTDHNGYFDKITYDYKGDKHPDLVINLLDYKTEENPHPDVQPLLNPAELKWQGMHEMFRKIAYDSFQDGGKMYRAIWKKALNTPELDDLAIAGSTWEQYDHGYWLKEKIFRMLDKQFAPDPTRQHLLREFYFTGQIDRVVALIEAIDPKPQAKNASSDPGAPGLAASHGQDARVTGEAFLPMGIWYEGAAGALRNDLIPSDPTEAAKIYNRDFADISAHGVNVAVVPNTPPEHHKALLDAAAANHLKLIIELGYEGGDLGAAVRGKSPVNVAGLNDTFHAMLDPIRDHPALYRVQLLDEPPPGTFDRYANVADALRAYDPKIGPFCCLVGSDNADAFLSATYSDVIAYDRYPISTKTPVGDIHPMQSFANSAIKATQAAMKNNAQAWAVIQCHAITNIHRFPTPAEIRCMTYSALAAGNKGVFWFLYQTEFWNKAKNEKMSGLVDENFKGDDRWAEIAKLTSEIKALAPTLLELKPAGDQPKSPGKFFVRALTDSKGTKYILEVNLDTLHSQRAPINGTRLGSNAEAGSELAPGDGALYRMD